MGCTDGGPDYRMERERWERDEARGYFRGGLGQPDTCLRCGCLVASNRYWDVHDQFHAYIESPPAADLALGGAE